MLREKQQRDAKQVDSRPMPAGYVLASSTKYALDWLRAFHPKDLKTFAANRSEAEREAMRAHLRKLPEKRKDAS